MSDNNTFVDPLDDLVARHQAAMNGDKFTSPDSPILDHAPMESEPVEEAPVAKPYDPDEYGDNDLANEIAQEDAQREADRMRRVQEAAEQKAEKEAKLVSTPIGYDKEYYEAAVGFQANKVSIVTTMVNKVVSKYRLISGGIPDNDVVDNAGTIKIKGRFKVMGDLTEIYEQKGEVITPEFERTILENWLMPDGSTAITQIKDGVVVDSTATQNNTNESSGADKNEIDEASNQPKLVAEAPTVNITVEKGTPVTVNVDDSIISKMDEVNQINVHVREVSDEEMLKSFVVENSQQDGIITPYDSGINDVPITLPMSGYRCVMRPINWLDFIKLSAPTSDNPTDNELKRWSVIYSHMKNVSIGEFKDFDDFLKKTKYADKELLMWGILVATADDQETLSFTCGNPKCRKSITIPYYPREIVHVEKDLIPPHFETTANAAIGPEAVDNFNKVNGTRKRYKLPHSGIIVEAGKPSAYEFITVKLPLIQTLYERYKPGESMSNANLNDPQLAEFDYLSSNAMGITSMSIVKKDDNGSVKEYRYTNWSDIEEIVSKALDAEDSGVLLKIIEIANSDGYPMAFYVPDVTCPVCGRHEDRIMINDIGNTLLFQLSRRLGNTTVNLIEMP